MTRDELKALWAELGENHYNHRIGDNANDIPPGPPRPGFDACDRYVPRFHAMLERHIRGREAGLCWRTCGRSRPRGTPDEVWNHGVGKYTAKFHAVPGEGSGRVRIEVELVAQPGLVPERAGPQAAGQSLTSTSWSTGSTARSTRPAAGACDWISVGGEAMFAPLNIMEVVESRWQGHNPMVTEANVRALDLANGGGGTGSPARRRTSGRSAPTRRCARRLAARRPESLGGPGALRRGWATAPNTPRRGPAAVLRPRLTGGTAAAPGGWATRPAGRRAATPSARS